MEKHLHYIWQFRLFEKQKLETTNGKRVKVIDVGLSNSDAGPDFFNAKIEIDGTLWAGDVEIHQKASDWKRHNHSVDKAYDSVILHVVAESDCETESTKGETIPQLIIPHSEVINQRMDYFLNKNILFPCLDRIEDINAIHWVSLKSRLLIERLEQKSENVARLLELNKGNWEEVFYVLLLRSLGMGINGDAFERLGRSLPLTILLKHADSLFQTEALLIGQAGLLNRENPENVYEEALRKEFLFLKRKFDLIPMEPTLWKMLRLRPSNFPHLRMAQAASLFHREQSLFSKIKEITDEEKIYRLFSKNLSEYWRTHYCFNNETTSHSGKMGKQTINVILINAVVPTLFAYGRQIGDELLCEKAYSWLEKITAEDNKYTRIWKNHGVEIENAFDSQALIQLSKEYCRTKKCLFCPIGHKLLSNTKQI